VVGGERSERGVPKNVDRIEWPPKKKKKKARKEDPRPTKTVGKKRKRWETKKWTARHAQLAPSDSKRICGKKKKKTERVGGRANVVERKECRKTKKRKKKGWGPGRTSS